MTAPPQRRKADTKKVARARVTKTKADAKRTPKAETKSKPKASKTSDTKAARSAAKKKGK